MADKDKMCHHFHEWVMRQYRYIQTTPKPPTTIEDLEPEDVVVAFHDFMVHVLTQAEMGRPILEDKLWRYVRGYVKWFYRVSHPMFFWNAPVVEYTSPVPCYENVIIEQQWARQVTDSIQIINNIRCRVDNAMSHPDVFSHPLFPEIMEGTRSEYIMMQVESVLRRRTRNHNPQE